MPILDWIGRSAYTGQAYTPIWEQIGRSSYPCIKYYWWTVLQFIRPSVVTLWMPVWHILPSIFIYNILCSNTLYFCTIYSTALHCTCVQYTLQHCTVLVYNILYSTALYILYSTALYLCCVQYTVQQCTVLVLSYNCPQYCC